MIGWLHAGIALLCFCMSPSPIFICPVWLSGWGKCNGLLAKLTWWSEPFTDFNWKWYLPHVHICHVHFVTDVSGVLGLLVFMGLYLDLLDHLALILPEAVFLGLVCVTGGAENWKVLPHCNTFSHLWLSWYAWIVHHREEKGVTFLLHGVNIMDSTVWSILCM